MRRLLDFEDEVVALAALALNRHALRGAEATFAESLYGLKREPHAAAAGGAAAAAAGGGGRGGGAGAANGGAAAAAAAPARPLGRSGEAWALAASVVLPYLQAKAERLHARHSQLRHGVLGLALRRAAAAPASRERQERLRELRRAAAAAAAGGSAAARAAATAAVWAAEARGALERAGRVALVLLVRAYPLLHAAAEAARLGYQAAFLLEASDVHSPVLAALGQRLVRVSAPELARLEQQRARRRAERLAAAERRGGGALARGAARAALRARFLLADHAGSALILAVFGFKALEWWYTTAEDRLAAGKALPPPPAPPPPAPHPDGVPLPALPSECPLCRRARQNPAALAVSGYVFCYPCIFNWVAQRRCCPVTRAPATLDHVRRLFEGA